MLYCIQGMTLIKHTELSKIRQRHRNGVIVFCSGVFDLTHSGHALFFEDCRKRGDILVVAVGDDASIKEYKGGVRPILNQHLRAKMVDSLKPVDYCLITPTYKKPGLLFLEYIFATLKPDKYVVNDDVPNLPVRVQQAKKYNMQLTVLKRKSPKTFGDISTSKIIEKIKEG